MVNKKVTCRSLLQGALILLGFSYLSLLPGLIPTANAQTNEARKKVIVRSTKPVGFKDNAARGTSKSNSLNPALSQSKDADEVDLDSASNLDYRVVQGCLRRNFNEDNLPASIGIDNRQLSEFFKTQTKTFFNRMRGDCIPYAAAFGSRNRFDSLSIMNGPLQDSKTEVWTFTPSAFSGFLIQQDYLKNESKNLTELQIPLRDVLYDPRKVGDILPVELVWELNSLIKQIYPEENSLLENTNSIVRLIVDFGDRERWAKIWATEIIDPVNKEVFASAYWVDRSDIPGGFFTGSGDSLCLLYTSPSPRD